MIDASTRPDPYASISDADYTAFRRDGHLLVRGALDEPLRARLEAAVDDPRTRRATGGVFHDPVFAELLDLPAVFPHIWGHLGWNIVVDHSHVEVDPPAPARPAPSWDWHQDGQDTDARPMLAMTAAYVLSDLSEPGRGAPLVLPGSQHGTVLTRPEPDPGGEYPRPAGAVEITAAPGDALVLDRRLWRSPSANHSRLTRKMIFIGYTYRWIGVRDVAVDAAYRAGLSPLRRQLLGRPEESIFGITSAAAEDDDIPLRAELKKRGLLDDGRHHLR
jgi:hypothetical protein